MKQFEELRDAWRRRKRIPLLLVFGSLTLPALLLAIFASGGWRNASLLFLGWNLGILMWVWDAPPEYIERKRRGAEGEKQTAAELAVLPPTWSVQHDVECSYGNWDHVVAGPAGVFMLDSKNLMGEAAVVNGVLELRRHECPDEVIRFDRLPSRTRGAAAELSRRLAASDWAPFVAGVVVVWPVLAPTVLSGDKVTYVSGPSIRNWLLAQPTPSDSNRNQLLAADLDARLRREDGGGE